MVNGRVVTVTNSSILKDNTEAAVLYRTGDTEESLDFVFTLAAGSNLPLAMMFLPLPGLRCKRGQTHHIKRPSLLQLKLLAGKAFCDPRVMLIGKLDRYFTTLVSRTKNPIDNCLLDKDLLPRNRCRAPFADRINEITDLLEELKGMLNDRNRS